MATKIGLRVLAIGLFAGTLDIADALIFNVLRGITPVMVLQYIGSGLIGTASPTIAAIVNAVLALMLCIGLPVFVLTSRYLRARDRG
jgi:bacteriorhodopsin